MRVELVLAAGLVSGALAVGLGGCGGNGSGTPTSNWPPALHDACATPSVGAMGVSLPSVRAVTSVALAWSGSEAAVAYVAEAMTSQPMLQRLDHDGNPLGAPIHLSPNLNVTFMARIDVISDGSSFIACWEQYDGVSVSVACASVPVGGSTATPGFATDASMGVQSHHPLMAYDGATRIVELGQGAVGPLHVLDPMGADTGAMAAQLSPPGLLAARSPGFVVATGGPPNLRFANIASDASAEPTPQTNDAQITLLDLAATPHASVVLGQPAGNGAGGLEVLKLGTSTTAKPLDEGMATDTQVAALARGKSNFAATWVTSSAVRYRALDTDGAPAHAGVDLTSLQGDLGDLMSATARPAMTMVAVDDGFLLATVNASGIVMTHLGCP